MFGPPRPQFPLALTRQTDTQLRFLFDGYNDDYFWWEAVVLLRKFMLSCVRVLVRSPGVQGQLGVLILFGCTMAQSLYVFAFPQRFVSI